MRNLNEDRNLRANIMDPPPEYHGYPDSIEVRRCESSELGESIPKNGDVACECIKTNIIYVLIMLIVVLVGVLSYTLLIVFEKNYDVYEPKIHDVDERELPNEQREWYDNAMNELRESVKHKHNRNKAKNIILFVGDGMGPSTTTASRIYKYGEEGRLSWESFPHSGLLKVNECLSILH